MLCKLCGSGTEKRFEALIMGRYRTSYYGCRLCGFLQTEEPVWLVEAYRNPINISDTGMLNRNIALREQVTVLLYHFFDPGACYLDFAGGYGIFTRLMRDVGFDFYWSDKYTENIFAQGFPYDPSRQVEVVTAFEVLEHLVDPLVELEEMLSVSRNLILTTEFLPDPVPSPEQWWYYGIEHGQHIAFYTRRSLELLAARFGLHYCRFRQLHLLTEKRLPPLKLKLVGKYLEKLRLFDRVRHKMPSKTVLDCQLLLRCAATPE